MQALWRWARHSGWAVKRGTLGMKDLGQIVRRTVPRRQRYVSWVMEKKFLVEWAGRSSGKFPGTSGWLSLNVVRSVSAWVGVVKGHAVDSEDCRNEGNAAYSTCPYIAVVYTAPRRSSSLVEPRSSRTRLPSGVALVESSEKTNDDVYVWKRRHEGFD
ncbi:hypothetical protein BJV77DRAFT_804560 [Russula vinacea]|nr:hypothetical protein BJV77DRAFT_804560 [Russula vinacea]